MVRYNSEQPIASPVKPKELQSLLLKDVKNIDEVKRESYYQNLLSSQEASVGAAASAPHSSCPLSALHHMSHNGPIKLVNYNDSRQITDTLHDRTKGHYCLGSLVNPAAKEKSHIKFRSKGDILEQAVEFIEEYFMHRKETSTEKLSERLAEIKQQIDTTGTYHLSTEELLFGAKTAWRNASRCIGRIQWQKIDLYDARNVKTPREMFHAICQHIKSACNGGNIKSSITVFPPRISGREDFRVWNHQLFAFAGYSTADGKIIGDAARIPFTRICEKLGWKGKGTAFDLLPVVVSAPGMGVEWFEIPSELHMMIHLTHPKFDWFAQMNLQWYALPAVSDMLFDVGGIEFPAAPFNGWYMGTEIASRNLCDESRYNLLPVFARKMALDTETNVNLWRDQVLVEVNRAVLHSFVKAGITIIDHHTASQSFMTHFANETKVRGGCPADWVWIVPPMSSSATGVFHQEMINYHLKPSYEYQVPMWKTWKWQKVELKYTFKSIASLLVLTIKLFKDILSKRVRVTVLYATETGKSEFFAGKLRDTLRENFHVSLVKMDEYEFEKLSQEKILFLVASTFGNGDPPDNGQAFWKQLNYRLRRAKACNNEEDKKPYLLTNLRYSVFGLGSSLYPTFGAFGKNLDKALTELGAQHIRHVTVGDELRGQQKLFAVWRETIAAYCVKKFVHHEDTNEEDKLIGKELIASDVGDLEAFNEDSFNQANVRLFTVSATRTIVAANNNNSNPDHNRYVNCTGDSIHLQDMLRNIHGEVKYRNIIPMKVRSRIRLLPAENQFDKQTILVRLNPATPLARSQLDYEPGDHLGIFPCNPSHLVEALLGYLSTSSPYIKAPNAPELFFGEQDSFSVEPVVIVQTRDSLDDEWVNHPRLPPCTIREALTHYLDIYSCPTPRLLFLLSTLANDRWDQFNLRRLSQEPEKYKQWRSFSSPNLLDVLKEYPSLHVPPEFLLMRLPLLQPRLYSISSSLRANPGEVHLTMSLVHWKPKSGSQKAGVCTSYMDHMPESQVMSFIRPATSFRLPEDLSVPIIMIAAGSGIAPFRSFWQERELQVVSRTGGRRLSLASNAGIGKMVLFFGCRSASVDHLFAEEMDDLLSRGVLHEVYLALSRDQNHKKSYVQDEVFKQRTLIYWLLMKENAHIYVCGDALMADGVRRSLLKMYESEGRINELGAQDAFDDLRDQGRYHEDIYGILHSSP